MSDWKPRKTSFRLATGNLQHLQKGTPKLLPWATQQTQLFQSDCRRTHSNEPVDALPSTTMQLCNSTRRFSAPSQAIYYQIRLSNRPASPPTIISGQLQALPEAKNEEGSSRSRSSREKEEEAAQSFLCCCWQRRCSRAYRCDLILGWLANICARQSSSVHLAPTGGFDLDAMRVR